MTMCPHKSERLSTNPSSLRIYSVQGTIVSNKQKPFFSLSDLNWLVKLEFEDLITNQAKWDEHYPISHSESGIHSILSATRFSH